MESCGVAFSGAKTEDVSGPSTRAELWSVPGQSDCHADKVILFSSIFSSKELRSRQGDQPACARQGRLPEIHALAVSVEISPPPDRPP